MEDNLKEFFLLKKKQEDLEHIIRRRMDTIRSSNDPNCWIQSKIRPTEHRLKYSDDFLRQALDKLRRKRVIAKQPEPEP